MQRLGKFLRVIFALVLREARVRHGRARIGYTWAIIEPVVLITILTILFSQFRSSGLSGREFALFFATGVLAFQLFRNTSTYLSMSFDANKPLFNYPGVKPMDAALARLVLDGTTHFLVIFLVLTFQIIVMDALIPHNIPFMVLSLMLLLLFAFGVGLTLAVVRRFMPAISNVYLVIMGPGFFVSGVFFSLADIPTFYREIVAWNPIIHGVEGFRSGYYLEYRDDDVSIYYLFVWVVCFNFIGLTGEWLTRFKQI